MSDEASDLSEPESVPACPEEHAVEAQHRQNDLMKTAWVVLILSVLVSLEINILLSGSIRRSWKGSFTRTFSPSDLMT